VVKDFATFPYKARSLTLAKEIEFNSIEDVYEELRRCYDKSYNKFPIGESLFVSHLFYSNPINFYDHRIQNKIKKVQYSLESNTPLYSTVQETPAQVVDEFLIYKNESQHCIDYLDKERKKKDGSKK
tara:strand:+ start:1584 stop:1964 length:381 start_codon:yes stop_codon:yes gene_type:complete